MSDAPKPAEPSTIDRLMQEMSQLPNLPLAPDPTPAPPNDGTSSPRDVRVQEVMDRYGLTREQAIRDIAAFGF